MLDPGRDVLECRALLELYHDLRAEHTAWVQRVHAVLFHQGAPAFGDLSRAGAPAQLAELARGRLSPAGQVQIAVYLRMLDGLEAELAAVRRRLAAAARQPAWRPDADGVDLRGRPGHRAGPDLLARRGRPVLLRAQGGPVLRPGHHRLSSDSKRPPGHLSRQGPPVLRWCAYEAGKTHARGAAPDHGYYAAVKDRAGGTRAALAEARKIIRRACHILTELGDDALTMV